MGNGVCGDADVLIGALLNVRPDVLVVVLGVPDDAGVLVVVLGVPDDAAALVVVLGVLADVRSAMPIAAVDAAVDIEWEVPAVAFEPLVVPAAADARTTSIRSFFARKAVRACFLPAVDRA